MENRRIERSTKTVECRIVWSKIKKGEQFVRQCIGRLHHHLVSLIHRWILAERMAMTRPGGSSNGDEGARKVRWSFPGTPQISTLLKQDQPARKEAIVRLYALEFPSASLVHHSGPSRYMAFFPSGRYQTLSRNLSSGRIRKIYALQSLRHYRIFPKGLINQMAEKIDSTIFVFQRLSFESEMLWKFRQQELSIVLIPSIFFSLSLSRER